MGNKFCSIHATVLSISPVSNSWSSSIVDNVNGLSLPGVAALSFALQANL